jgi:hypothetical protein
MSTVAFANVRGETVCPLVQLDRLRRRLSTIVARYAPKDRPFLKTKVVALGIDPAEPGHGHRLMREQRSRTWQLGGASIAAVGGWCQIATVSKYGVSPRVLERWAAS